jgi:hypothetical protein
MKYSFTGATNSVSPYSLLVVHVQSGTICSLVPLFGSIDMQTAAFVTGLE